MSGPITPNDGTGSNQAGPMLDAKTLAGPRPVAAPAAEARPNPWARSGAGHPVMFVLLGGVLVIGALVGTGLYLGQAEGSGRRAVETSPAPATAPPPAAPEPAATPNPPPAPPTATDATPAATPAATAPSETAASPAAPPPPAPSNDRAAAAATAPPATDVRPHAPASGSPAVSRATPAKSSNDAAPAKAATPRQPARDDARPRENAPNGAAVLDQLEREVDQLTVRVEAVNNGLDHLQREQARQGFGLRGDMAARQSSMNLNISRAQDALSKRDAARAQRYRDSAEADIEALEKFLGR